MQLNIKKTQFEVGIEKLQSLLKYSFHNVLLLETALTHSSYANEFPEEEINERLEFLGDAVLELVITDKLFFGSPEKQEGDLTFLRSEIVCEKSLNKAGEKLGLKQLLRVGKDFGAKPPTDSMTADCMEAVFGAVYIDGGYKEAERIITQCFWHEIIESNNCDLSSIKNKNVKNPKGELQEYLQQNGRPCPKYRVVEKTGPENALHFRVELLIDNVAASEGWGSSIKKAEAAAASSLLDKIRTQNGEKNL